MSAPSDPFASRWPALAMIGAGGTLIIIGAVVWLVFEQTIPGVALAALGAALEATGVVRLVRTLKKK